MIKSLILNSKCREKLLALPVQLSESDVENSLKGLHPGEWCIFRDVDRKKLYLGFVNPIAVKGIKPIHVVSAITVHPNDDVVKSYLKEMIERAIKKREKIEGYAGNSRQVFGYSDGLPGLVIDGYENCVIMQINTAGIDKHREYIRDIVGEYLKKKVYILDHQQLRSREMLPSYREIVDIETIIVAENRFKYSVPIRTIQKVGWYYDHRENRRKLEDFLVRWKGEVSRAVDLFCYQGSWGMHALRSGLTHVDFVDQADMKDAIYINLKQNKLKNHGKVYRCDVFKWLDEKNKSEEKYDLIISDPPAFAKSKSEKESALEGYVKLHKKIFRLASKESLVVFASCTHYVTSDEFFTTIQRASSVEKRKIQIMDVGMQAWDHPFEAPNSKSNYIKYYLVYVE